MITKRLVSGFAALTMAVSAFAAFSVTAGATTFTSDEGTVVLNNDGDAAVESAGGISDAELEEAYQEFVAALGYPEDALTEDDQAEIKAMLAAYLENGYTIDEIIAMYTPSLEAIPSSYQYATIWIPKIDGVTYYYDGDTFEAMYEYFVNKNVQWMQDKGITIDFDTESKDHEGYYVFTLEGHEATYLDITYTIDKDSDIKGLTLPSPVRAEKNEALYVPVSENGSGTIRMTLTYTGTDAASQDIYKIGIEPIKTTYDFTLEKGTTAIGYDVNILDNQEGNGVKKLSDNTAEVETGETVQFAVGTPAGYRVEFSGAAQVTPVMDGNENEATTEDGKTIYRCTVTRDTTVRVNLVKNSYLVSLAVSGTGISAIVDDNYSGKVNSASAYVPMGGEGNLTFTVTVPDGYEPVFSKPSVTSNVNNANSNKYDCSIPENEFASDETITISLAKKQYTVSLVNDGNATVGGLSATGTKVEHGGSVTFTVVPATNYVVTVTANGGTLIQNGNTYTLSNVTKDTEVTVNAEQGTYTITDGTSNKDGYTITVNDETLGESETTINYGDPAKITVTAEKGYGDIKLYSNHTLLTAVNGVYTIPTTNTADCELQVEIVKYSTLTFTDKSTTFDDENAGSAYTAHYFTTSMTKGTDGVTSVTIGVRADGSVPNENGVSSPYNKSYQFPGTFTLDSAAALQFGVVAPASVDVTVVSDLNGGSVPATSNGVTPEIHNAIKNDSEADE